MSQTLTTQTPATTKPSARHRRVGERKWFSVREIAEIYGVQPATIRKWIADLGLPALIVNHKRPRGRYNAPGATIRINFDRFREWERKRTVNG